MTSATGASFDLKVVSVSERWPAGWILRGARRFLARGRAIFSKVYQHVMLSVTAEGQSSVGSTANPSDGTTMDWAPIDPANACDEHGFHGADGDSILSIVSTGSLAPNDAGEIFLGGSARETFMHGGDRVRGETYSLEMIVRACRSMIVRGWTYGVQNTTLLHTGNGALRARSFCLHVRRRELVDGEFRVQITRIEGGEAITEYLEAKAV